jgi:hypothetical protein
MSWKNLASVALCALMASQALAVPSLQIAVPAGLAGLDANGNWIWQVSVTPDTTFFVDNPPNGVGGSVAVELGLTASGGGGLVSGSPSTVTANVHTATTGANANPGNVIFGWEALTDVGGGNMKPVGLQDSVANDQVFAALGTIYFTNGGGKHILTVISDGPSTSNLTSSLALHDSSIIAQNNPASTDDTFDFAAGSASRTVRAGDANLDNTVDVLDLDLLGQNWNQSGRHWGHADYNGDGTVDVLDLDTLGQNWNQSGGSNNPLNSVPSGGGAGGGAAVPEPASFVLAGLALIAGLGLVRK